MMKEAILLHDDLVIVFNLAPHYALVIVSYPGYLYDLVIASYLGPSIMI